MLHAYLTPLVALTLAAASCAGDEAPATPGTAAPSPGDTVLVVAQDIAFGKGPFEATAGTVSFQYHNEGRMPHSLVLEGIDDFRLEVTGNRDDDYGSVHLQPGSYTIYCDIPGHRDVGMEADLTVEPRETDPSEASAIGQRG